MNIPRIDGTAPRAGGTPQPSAPPPAAPEAARPDATIRNLAGEARTQLSKLGESHDGKRTETIEEAKAERARGELTSPQNLYAAAESLLDGDGDDAGAIDVA